MTRQRELTRGLEGRSTVAASGRLTVYRCEKAEAAIEGGCKGYEPRVLPAPGPTAMRGAANRNVAEKGPAAVSIQDKPTRNAAYRGRPSRPSVGPAQPVGLWPRKPQSF